MTLKAKWLKALRSKKYPQTNGSLKVFGFDSERSGYCCLGVLADVINPRGWKGEVWRGHCSSLPRNVLSDVIQDKLITMNDNKGHSFKVIAAWIAKNVKPSQIKRR